VYAYALWSGLLVFSLFQILTVLALVLAAYNRRLAILRYDILSWLRIDATGRVQGLSDKHFDASEAYWPKILTMVDQVLDYDRLLFFERVPGHNRLQDSKAVGCGFDAVVVDHRDLARPPFSTAVSHNGPLRVDNFLRAADDTAAGNTAAGNTAAGETQFLVPLVVGNQVQGIWAIALDEESSEERESILGNFGKEIAVVLFLHHQFVAQKQQLQQQPEQLDHQELAAETHSSVLWLEDRLERTQRLLHSLGQPLIVYDLLGHVQTVSAAMSHILTKAQLSPENLTPVELAVALTGVEPGVARGWMRQAIQRETTVRSVTQPAGDKHYVLRVHPLTHEIEQEPPQAAPEGSFDVHGIVLELIDVTESRRLSELTKATWRRYERELRNSLEGFSLASQLLKMPDLPDEKRLEIGKMLQDKVDETVGLLAESQDLVAREWQREEAINVYEVDAVKVLKQALDDLAEPIAEKKAEIKIERPDDLFPVKASPGRLKDLFATTLRLLLESVQDEGVLTVEIVQKAGITHLALTNRGHRKAVNEDVGRTGVYDLAIRELHNGMTWAASWDGSLDFEDGVDPDSGETGVWLHLKLKTCR
jgi:hypothetical protein